jgi:hypothetical protein
MTDTSTQETLSRLWVRALWTNPKTRVGVQILQPDDSSGTIYLRFYGEGHALCLEKRYPREQLEVALLEGKSMATLLGCTQQIRAS